MFAVALVKNTCNNTVCLDYVIYHLQIIEYIRNRCTSYRVIC